MMNYSNPYGMSFPLYNPNLTPQQRLAQMEAQYPQYAPQPQIQTQPNGLNVIPVTDIAEANAFRVDLNGTPTFFYNAGKNEVYLKKTNVQTGAADFFVYNKAELPTSEEKPVEPVKIYENDFKTLYDKIDGLYSLLTNQPIDQVEEEQVKKGGKNAK